MFKKILIANRGEIAVRIIKTCKRLGIRTVAVFSEIDARSLHVREADEAVYLGPSPSGESYLAGDKVIAAALAHQCEAIHPGYGFLSENAAFAEAAAKAGLVFIGPPAPVIASLGDKIAAKNLALKAGVPTVPGESRALETLDEVRNAAESTGYPVLIKPAAGGGGRGMRIVTAPEELPQALRSAQEETRKAFGDNRIFVERFVVEPRHIEFQIIADQHGNVIHLGERECSIQRRYQKVIEESPSTALDENLRNKMGEMACSLARESGYTNAGTVEFILDQAGNFYFMEMNTRLQVEHPVTELVTGLDLVELQLQVAAGERLPFSQGDVRLQGWAIEARICAEDSSRNFLPSTGLVTRYSSPHGRGIRLDSGIAAGSFVSVFYDSLLAKVISWGKNREEARQFLIQGLNRYHVEGLVTNIDFANAILNLPAFAAGNLTTAFIDENFINGEPRTPPAQDSLEAMVIASTLVYHNRKNLIRQSLKPMATRVGATPELQTWQQYIVKGEKNIFAVRLMGNPDSRDWDFFIDETEYEVVAPDFEFYRRRLRLKINGENQYFRLQYRENFIWTAFRGITRIFEVYTPREWEYARHMPMEKKTSRENVLLSPLPGMVVNVLARKGDRVYQGQDLVIIESMKMESGVSSPCSAEIEEVKIEPGRAVETGDVLITFKKEETGAAKNTL